jgi:hypothetical protein
MNRSFLRRPAFSSRRRRSVKSVKSVILHYPYFCRLYPLARTLCHKIEESLGGRAKKGAVADRGLHGLRGLVSPRP